MLDTRTPAIHNVVMGHQHVGMTNEIVEAIIESYNSTGSIHDTAEALNYMWPLIHSIVFDLKRSGVIPRRKPKNA